MIMAAWTATVVADQHAGEMTLDAKEAAKHFTSREYSHYAGRNFPNQVMWGNAEKREPDNKGNLPPVGNTVDVKNATWTNTIGDPELITVWKDPDFDPNQRAFYYARLIEIPTPRWTAYDAKRYGVTMAENVPTTTQDRAYTSPIWYTP
jgi:hypothetical protein